MPMANIIPIAIMPVAIIPVVIIPVAIMRHMLLRPKLPLRALRPDLSGCSPCSGRGRVGAIRVYQDYPKGVPNAMDYPAHNF